MKDRFELPLHFDHYLKELYRLSLTKLRVTHNGTFQDNFKSLKLVTNLSHLKTEKIQTLFDFLRENFDKKKE
jgi:hypothetical protein